MPKRKHEETEEDKWRRKLKKYEQKLSRKRRRHRRVSIEEYLEPDSGASMPSSPDRSPTPTAAVADGIPADSTRPVDELGTSARFASPVPPELSTMGGSVSQPADPQGVTAPAEDANTDGDNVPPIADPELLRALGDFEAETADWGPDIVADLSKRWAPILKDGLKKETREELMKKYLLPKNCPLIKAPVLNPEIAAMLNESAKNRDARIQKKQSLMGCVLAILGRTMSGILTKSSDTADILRFLADATKLLSDSHYLETETRRSLVTPMVDKTFLEPFKDRKRDSHLFGEKLGEFIKSSRGIQKTGKLIQPAAQTSTLNYKVPPSRQPYHRFVRGQPRRGGGTRPGSNYRRRGTMTRAPRASSPHQHPASRHKPAGAAPTTSAKQ
ncbi:hypothetical protein PYW07_011884 [Mythimna separata]|uniref:Uncharacterized protein n=1 Tax=Mythimna separata TaxID=271217 RepID=A0AAD8DKT4_MYTSE|nr:hypothetical protein PYW07_011884 [Mythimna separata]